MVSPCASPRRKKPKPVSLSTGTRWNDRPAAHAAPGRRSTDLAAIRQVMAHGATADSAPGVATRARGQAASLVGRDPAGAAPSPMRPQARMNHDGNRTTRAVHWEDRCRNAVR
jgi:hypothetical protein